MRPIIPFSVKLFSVIVGQLEESSSCAGLTRCARGWGLHLGWLVQAAIRVIVSVTGLLLVLLPEHIRLVPHSCGLNSNSLRAIVQRCRAGKSGMGSRIRIVFVVLTAVILVGCSSTNLASCQCPKLVAYDDATLKKISQALRALPADNILHEAMDDYENERDNLRFCPAGSH